MSPTGKDVRKYLASCRPTAPPGNAPKRGNKDGDRFASFAGLQKFSCYFRTALLCTDFAKQCCRHEETRHDNKVHVLASCWEAMEKGYCFRDWCTMGHDNLPYRLAKRGMLKSLAAKNSVDAVNEINKHSQLQMALIESARAGEVVDPAKLAKAQMNLDRKLSTANESGRDNVPTIYREKVGELLFRPVDRLLILAGVALFPQTFTVAPASVVAGIVIAITGKYTWFTWGGWAVTTLGMGLMLLLKVDTSTPAWIFINLVPGVGTGVLFSAMAITVQASASNEDQAHAVTSFALFRALGQTVGVAVGGTIFQNQMKKKLLTSPLLVDKATEYYRDASGLVQIIKQMPEGLAEAQLKLAYVDAARYIWIFCCALAGVAFIASLWTKALPLDREHETQQGFKHTAKPVDEEAKVTDDGKDTDLE